jgi:hypothetical protein
VSFGPLNNCLPRVPIQYTLLPVLDPHCLQILSYVIFLSDLRSSYCPGRFTPGTDPISIVQEAGWAPGPVWTYAKNLAPTGIFFLFQHTLDPRTVQPIASRYTERATWPTMVIYVPNYFGYVWSVLCILCLVVCNCVLCYCHRVSTQVQLNIYYIPYSVCVAVVILRAMRMRGIIL